MCEAPATASENFLKVRRFEAQHIGGVWRLRAVETEPRSWAAVLTRTAVMLSIAVLLILVLLPAALAASNR
jgi:hypothetical protein